MKRTKTTLLAGAAIGALMMGPVLAADMPVKAPPPVPPPAAFNWSGIYAGAHVGGAFGTKGWSSVDPTLTLGIVDLGSHDIDGFLAGGQVGFNWQAPGSNWVLGIEVDASWTNADGSHLFDIATLSSEVNWFGTVTGRIGYAFDRVLIYAKGGFAFADESYEVDDGLGNLSVADKTRTGWTVGGGIEIAFDGNWSIKGEYNFIDLGDKEVAFPTGVASLPLSIDQEIHVAKFGINYRFGPVASPVAARY
jgi:outer membrane immunogenic protein